MLSAHNILRLVLPDLRAKHLRELLIVGIGQAGAFVASVATLKILTSRLPPETYGQFNLVLVGMILPSWLFLSPLTQGVVRWYSRCKETGQLGQLLHTSVLANAFLTVMACVLGAALVALDSTFGVSSRAWILALMIFFIESWTTFCLGVANAARRRLIVATVGAITPWIRLFSIFGVIVFFGGSLAGVLTGYLLASLLVMVLVLLNFKREFTATAREFDASLLKSMLLYGAPFGVWSIFAWGQQYVDRYVVTYSLGTAAAGAYIATLQVAALPVNLAGGLLLQFLGPIIYQRAGDASDPARVAMVTALCFRAAAAFLLFGLAVLVALATWGRWLMTVVANGEYLIASNWTMPLMAAGALFFMLGQIFTMTLLARNLSAAALWTKVLPALAGFPIVLAATHAMQLNGAAIGYMVTGILFLIVVLVSVARSPA